MVTWVIDWRKNFTGPQTGVVNAVEAEEKGMALGVGVEQEKMNGDSNSSSQGSGGVVGET